MKPCLEIYIAPPPPPPPSLPPSLEVCTKV